MPSRKRPGRDRDRLQRRQIETGFNVTYLMDALSNMSQDMVCIDLNDSAVQRAA